MSFSTENAFSKTGGQLKLTGSHTSQFAHAGTSHEVTLSWGHASLRSFPIEVHIDGHPILKSRVFNRNWPLSLCPWVVVAALIIYNTYKP